MLKLFSQLLDFAWTPAAIQDIKKTLKRQNFELYQKHSDPRISLEDLDDILWYFQFSVIGDGRTLVSIINILGPNINS